MVSKITKIVHCKKENYDIYIGRPSIFGNPYSIGKDGIREEVIEKYRQYFIDRINNDYEFQKKIIDLSGKTLGCWCKPLPCHGDIIIKYLNEKD